VVPTIRMQIDKLCIKVRMTLWMTGPHMKCHISDKTLSKLNEDKMFEHIIGQEGK